MTLDEIEERLTKATGPDREIDDLIWRTLESVEFRRKRTMKVNFFVEHYTASLDAAVALVERVLPGWNWMLSTTDEGEFVVDMAPQGVPGGGPTVDHKTAPLALCLALIRALRQQEGKSK